MTTKKTRTKVTVKPKSTKESPKVVSKVPSKKPTKRGTTPSSTTLLPRARSVIITVTNRDEHTATVNIKVDPEDISFDELIRSPCGALSAAILQILSGLFDYNVEGFSGQNSLFKASIH